MKVTMKTLMAGPNGCHHPGQVIERSPEECQELIKGGFAVLVQEPTPKVVEPQEESTDEEKRGRRRGR